MASSKLPDINHCVKELPVPLPVEKSRLYIRICDLLDTEHSFYHVHRHRFARNLVLILQAKMKSAYRQGRPLKITPESLSLVTCRHPSSFFPKYRMVLAASTNEGMTALVEGMPKKCRSETLDGLRDYAEKELGRMLWKV